MSKATAIKTETHVDGGTFRISSPRLSAPCSGTWERDVTGTDPEKEDDEEYVEEVEVGVEEPLVFPPPSNSPVYAVSERILGGFPAPKLWPFM